MKKALLAFLAILLLMNLMTFICDMILLNINPVSPEAVTVTAVYVFLFILLSIALLITIYFLEKSLRYYELRSK